MTMEGARYSIGLIKADIVDMFNRQSRRSYGDTGVDVTTDARVLFDAVRHGKNHLVRFILEASSVDIVNSRDLHGKTPLMACCYTKEEGSRDNIVRLLLRHGADVNLTDDCGRTVLSYVCERRCNDILRILIKEHNIDPDITDTNGNTPLIYSAMVGNDIACDILIRHFRRLGLNVDALNDEGFTALLMAAKHGNITCAQILLGQGKSSIKHRDNKFGLSVEEWLAKKGFSLQDIAPVRNDGKGRSRFVKLANIAAICSGPKKSIQQQPGFGDFNMNNYPLGKYEDDDDQYINESTSDTDMPLPRYFSRYSDIDLELAAKHYRMFPYQYNRPPQRTQATQTGESTEEEGNTIIIPSSSATENGHSSGSEGRTGLKKDGGKRVSPERKIKSGRSHEKLPDVKNANINKRLSLPDIEQNKPMVARSDSSSGKKDRKKSLDALPEKLVANIDTSDNRRHMPQSDSPKNKPSYWPTVSEHDDSSDKKALLSLQFDRQRISASDSDASANEDGPVF